MVSIYLIFILLYFIWLVIYVVQRFLVYEAAYRKTKKTGDNGIHLFIWLFVYGLAATIPFCAIICGRSQNKRKKSFNLKIRPYP